MNQTSLLEGMQMKVLETHHDERGYFRELLRSSDPFFHGQFGQWSMSQTQQGVLKAWHIHKKQTDWWFAASGLFLAAFHDTRPQSSTFNQTIDLQIGDDCEALIIKVPPGVAHGYQCLKGPGLMFYVTSHEYDATDEGRIDPHSQEIGYQWKLL